MKIRLFIGEGWTPFMLEENESVAWRMANINDLDVAASIDKLGTVFEERIREIYSDAEIEVLPRAQGNGHLVTVELAHGDVQSADQVLALDETDLQDDGFSPAAIIEGEIAGILDGIIQDRTHTWQVEK